MNIGRKINEALPLGAIIHFSKRWKTLPVYSWVKGAKMFEAGRFSDAAKQYKKGIEKRKAHPAINNAKFDLSYCLYRAGELQDSLEYLKQVTSKEETPKEAFLLQSRIYLVFGKQFNAIETLKECARRFPEDIAVLASLLHLLSHTDETKITRIIKDRLTVKRRLISVDDPKLELIDAAIAIYEIKRGDIKRGERLLSRVLSSGYAPYEAIVARGELWLNQGRVAQGREILNKAVKSCPRDTKPLLLLARSYMISGAAQNLDFAKQLATEAAQISNWQNSDVLSLLIEIHEARGEYELAEMFLIRFLNLSDSADKKIPFISTSTNKARIAHI